MVDKLLIQRRIDDITQSLKRLEKITKIGKEKFLENQDVKDIASYRLITLIEAAISICQHICAREIKKAPGNYADCFEILSKYDIIPAELAEKLQKMVRLRNMLIHIYWNIDYELVYKYIENNLDDVKKFIVLIINNN